jgi:hypothetical protein
MKPLRRIHGHLNKATLHTPFRFEIINTHPCGVGSVISVRTK